jgi:hypothetical protein
MTLGVLPSFIEPSIKPWLAHKEDKWPVIDISQDIYKAAKAKGGASKQATLDLIGKAAWAKYLGGPVGRHLGLWEWAVRTTTDPEKGIQWQSGDSLKQVVCMAHIHLKEHGQIEARLMGWMHNGELMALSEPGRHCPPPYRPANTLKGMAEHLSNCAGLLKLAEENRDRRGKG